MLNADAKRMKYLELLSGSFPTENSVFTEIINLQAIQNLPKGTEHFISDIHGEYEAFRHIMNNCSGVIREKVSSLFESEMTEQEIRRFCTLIYYPREVLDQAKKNGPIASGWYAETLEHLIQLSRFLSSKYTRSKVRKAMPVEFAYIIDELMHAQKDEDNNRQRYHQKIVDSIIETGSADDFIFALCSLIKRLAVDWLHVLGDIYDRGPHGDMIMDLLMEYRNRLDITWGNHDIPWMAAAFGSKACIAEVVRNNLHYRNYQILESSYGISLRKLAMFAGRTYTHCGKDGFIPEYQAISVIMFKLEGQIIRRHPEFGMDDLLLLHRIDLQKGTVEIDGRTYELKTKDFPTIDPAHPYELTPEEEEIMDEFMEDFRLSRHLQEHVDFLYTHGSMYHCVNGNLLYHGCIPLDENGNFQNVNINGRIVQGKSLLDECRRVVHNARRHQDQNSLDLMWYMAYGYNSPLFGRRIRTFARTYIADESTWEEPRNPYYQHRDKKTALMILHEFGLYGERCHIINGHTPVHAANGESPVRADGLLYVIDGGFCKAYQKTTGIAGYTLIFNSHGLRLKAHRPFQSLDKVLSEDADIESDSEVVEVEKHRVMVADTDDGVAIREKIADLTDLLEAYRSGQIK